MGTQIAPVPVSDTRDVQANISAVVRLFMALHDLNQGELAAELDTNQPRISDKLAGRRRWHVEDVAKLAAHFDVPADIFFQSADEVLRSRCFTAPGRRLLTAA